MFRFATLAAFVLVPPAAHAADPAKTAALTPQAVEFFEKKIRPVLAEHCYSCHGPKKAMAGLRLDTADGLKKGTDEGPVVKPGDPAASKLVKAVRRLGDFPMPPKNGLPEGVVNSLTEWVKIGAPFPEAEQGQKKTDDPRNHWAFKPVVDPKLPAASPASSHPIDRFLLAKLQEKGLGFAPEADKRTLIRRAYLDLIGLPPTVEETEAFVKDSDPKAWEKLIDKLLASPQYGERWARHWLDVARYADTKGYVFQEDRNYPYAYTYRDYVIRSLNEDKPYDQFVIEQLAADRLNLGDDKRPLAALGFLTLGRRFLNNSHDIIDDRIDVVTRGLMGLTVSCARCHDHKFDPIPIADYYSLYGVFASSTEPKDLPLIGTSAPTPELEKFETEVKKLEASRDAEIEKRHSANVAKLRSADAIAAYLLAFLENRGKSNDQLQAYLRQRDLNSYLFTRWKPYLTEQLRIPSRVFGPLSALANLPEKDFAAKAVDALDAAATQTAASNPLVIAAIRAAKPQSLKEVTTAYGKLIAAHWPPPGGKQTKDDIDLTAVLGGGSPTDVPLADRDKIQTRADRDAIANLQKKLDGFKAASPAAPPRAMVLNDAPNPFQPVVFLRGNPGNRGAQVPRQFLGAISSPNRKPFTDGSGRLELAKAIASKDNPLTARVFVNRVWGYHFGRGLVNSPSNFGTRSDPPSHPELLDWLAVRFVESGWSVKNLHRLMLTSTAYRQSSVAPPAALKADPENKLLGWQFRQRLDFEALRDSMLAVTGNLDSTLGGRPVDLFKAPFAPRRSVYGFIDRQNLPGTFRAFDFAGPDQHSPQRFQTTVPQQALFLMNSPFVTAQAKALAARPELASAKLPAERVTKLYRTVLGRNPTSEETAAAVGFITDAGPGADKAGFGPWEQLAQVLLLSNEFAFAD